MFGDKKVSAILLAGGSGSRMELDVNKVFLSLKSPRTRVLFFPLAALYKNKYIDEIIIVCRLDEEKELEAVTAEIAGIFREFFPKKPIKMTVGGENRYDSVYNGLLKVSGDIAIIHDGARPILKQRIISGCVEAMNQFHGAIVGMRNVDRLCSVDENGLIDESAEFPQNVYLVQTPQCFHTKIIKECHKKISDKSNVKDDSTLLELCGYNVKMLPGDKSNVKITYPEDLKNVEYYIQNDEEHQNGWNVS